ncbi:hypothetical protein [Variovorax sp. PBS-H4]|uniref:hypothetical protein n=1 Tax=Variovorax sp. PBS-H4 TaxID=434008 RepID=UPI0013A537AE|nr:hypothetical protein [Variovorax sp. PBS-H4]
MKYSGPLYFDFDAEDVKETIPHFQLFLVNLRDDQGVNLEQLRLYATGGRGFHIEVPEEIFMPRVPRTGVQSLPYVYKEMAHELVVETLDMRVFTGRKGRMWRTPNIVRSNGKYKVPITLEEALAMTPELYDELTSEPRAEPERAAPTTAIGLTALYVKSQHKINEAVKRSAKNQGDLVLLAKFKGEFPATMKRILAGESIMPDKGFHPIAMQLAIAASAMGKTANELVEAAEGLCKNHSSDSQRYNSPRKRKEELRRMFDYVHENPCYGFSAGGLRSLLEPGTPSSDLDTVDRSLEGNVPMGDEEESLSEEQVAEIELANRGQTAGVSIHRLGMFVRNGEGLKPLSHIAFIKPTRLLSAEDRMHIGFECDVLAAGKRHSTSYVPLDTFKSRARMHETLSAYGGTFMGNDVQAGAILTVLDSAAREAGREVFTVHREGLDIVQNPNVVDEISRDVIWAAPDVVLSHNPDVNYRFRSRLSNEPVYRSDVHECAPIENTPETREWLHHLFQINDPMVVAQMFGWFVSCLHKQHYQEAYNQFPLLHPNGTAGSGKTQTTGLFARLWHNTTKPLVYGCGVSLTPFMLKSACQGSASIPLILDEYKPAEFAPGRHDLLLATFKLAYNQARGATGGISRGGATSSFRDVTNFEYSAPIVYMAESQEMTTAVLQRSLPVSFTRRGAEARTAHFEAARDGIDFMPRLGAALLRAGMVETVESRKEAIKPLVESLRASLDRNVHDRQVYNLAIVLAGLNFLDGVLKVIFGDEFIADIDVLRQAVHTNQQEIAVQAINETAKVLNDMAVISTTEAPDSEFALRNGYEYVIGEDYIEILMRESFIKYNAWNKRKGFPSLFASADAFIVATSKSDAVTDKLCLRSPIRKSGQSRVFRFSLQKLAAEGVEMFRDSSQD